MLLQRNRWISLGAYAHVSVYMSLLFCWIYFHRLAIENVKATKTESTVGRERERAMEKREDWNRNKSNIYCAVYLGVQWKQRLCRLFVSKLTEETSDSLIRTSNSNKRKKKNRLASVWYIATKTKFNRHFEIHFTIFVCCSVKTRLNHCHAAYPVSHLYIIFVLFWLYIWCIYISSFPFPKLGSSFVLLFIGFGFDECMFWIDIDTWKSMEKEARHRYWSDT